MNGKTIDNLFFGNGQRFVRNCIMCTMWTWNLTDQQHTVCYKGVYSTDIWIINNAVSSGQYIIADDPYEKDQ